VISIGLGGAFLGKGAEVSADMVASYAGVFSLMLIIGTKFVSDSWGEESGVSWRISDEEECLGIGERRVRPAVGETGDIFVAVGGGWSSR
jgi:hypothetical protein